MQLGPGRRAKDRGRCLVALFDSSDAEASSSPMTLMPCAGWREKMCEQFSRQLLFASLMHERLATRYGWILQLLPGYRTVVRSELASSMALLALARIEN